MTETEIKDILNNLKTTVVTVTFIKKNGEKRVMHCTTNLDAIPEEHHPHGTGRASPEGLYKVFDVDKQDWRSFRLSSVIDVQI